MPKTGATRAGGVVNAATSLNTATSEEKAHAVYGASSSHRWLNCPGSIDLCAKVPEPPESPYAAEGTKAHACLEFVLKNRQAKPEAVRAAALRQYPVEMVDHAFDAWEYLEERLAEHPGAELLCETRVDAAPFTMSGQFGTLDAAIVDDFGRLVVVDYKYGAGYAVDPEGDDGKGNSQLVYYALGLSYQYHHNFSEVELVVIQPRAYHVSGETTRTFTMSMNELLAWKQVFRDGVMATGDSRAAHNPGPWCKFCAGGIICPKLKTEALKKAQVAFSDEGGVVAAPEPSTVQLPHLGTILDGCEQLEAWIEKVRAHAFGLLQRGKEIPGYKLVEKRPSRRWADPAEVADEAELLFGELAFKAPKLLPPGKLKDLFGKGRGQDARKWIEARTVLESSGPTLARDDDKRAAVVGRRSAKAAFTAIDVEATSGKSTPETKRKK